MASTTKNENDQAIEKILTTWGIIVILWSIFRANIVPPLWFSELVAKPLVFLLPVYFFYKKSSPKQKSFLSFIGFPSDGSGVKEFVFALSLLIFVFGMGIVMFVTSGENVLLAASSINYLKFTELFGLALVTSVVEEVVGRGFLFNHLYRFSKSLIVSLFVSAILFFVLYLPGALTVRIGGQALVMNLVLNVLLSFVTGILFYMRRGIVAPIAFHLAILLWFDLLLANPATLK